MAHQLGEEDFGFAFDFFAWRSCINAHRIRIMLGAGQTQRFLAGVTLHQLAKTTIKLLRRVVAFRRRAVMLERVADVAKLLVPVDLVIEGQGYVLPDFESRVP